ncbi:sugar phosphate nucleotidyltransferase [Sphaerochaeta globosa]|uniref:Mannose-1-phosphate guanylyltransferase n=1 Tax=Sphaerochaeta globosa (strain ATCC BAA-1886 / DSM 22777 / Buddy) TaxID=158189 RepID=F0RUD2_SPHGB|nr:sugar phosphate nucleotidyltransferase [Sphaerochaeta globosa]ADY12294.1 Mannose-1-phosphate guanylyltransferase [Sphaerochaeta globosa str. Buddy]
MHIVLLSGGSGKRLWPLSNEIRSKQFIKFFKQEDGTYESMLQRVHRQIRAVDPNATITIATSSTQVSAIHNQLGKDVGISVEPCRRDTFPAIALAASYVHDIQGVGEEEAVVVCPVDPFVDDDYFSMLEQLGLQAQQGSANLVLLGITPTYASEKYGYILPSDTQQVSKVSTFKEKPDSSTAQTYIDKGAVWNAGVFAFKLGYLLKKAHQLIDFTDYHDLYAKYETLSKISFDYAVVEHEKAIEVMRYSGQWKDLGTWNTLTEAMSEPIIGEGRMDEGCRQVHIINELDVPVLAMGLSDVIICASAQGILVSDRTKSSFIKPFVDAMEQRIMFAEKSWGDFKIFDVGAESLTIKLTIKAGSRMSYHSHQRRSEVWTIIEGTGQVVLDGQTLEVHAGSVVTLSVGCRHTIIALTELTLMEIQIGKDIKTEDKQVFQLD